MLLRHACSANIRIKEDHRSDNLKKVPSFGLYIANHQSIMDIPLVMNIYQVPPIMKKEILYIPIFGWLAWASGAFPVSRGSLKSRKKTLIQARKRLLEDKIGVQVYPEGTRSKTGSPKSHEELKKSLLVFAYNQKIPVIPTSLYGTRGTINQFGLIKPNREFGIIVHQEMHPEQFHNQDDFIKAAWGKVIAGHDHLKAQIGN